jgi:hypothetical protein
MRSVELLKIWLFGVTRVFALMLVTDRNPTATLHIETEMARYGSPLRAVRERFGALLQPPNRSRIHIRIERGRH